MKGRTWVVLAVIVVAAGLLLAFVGGGPGALVRTESVRRGTIEAWVEDRGRTRLPRTEVVAMPVTARVMPITLREGDRVAAGEVVARLERADLETAVEAAEARVAYLDAAIAEAADTRVEETTLAELDHLLTAIDRDVEAADARLEATSRELAFAEAELERVRAAAEDGAARPRELEAAEVALTEARIAHRVEQLRRARQRSERDAEVARSDRVQREIDKKALRVAVLREERREAGAALEQARRDLARAEVTSPVDGVVLVRHEASRRMLPAGTPLLELGRLEELEAVVDLLSQDAARVAPGDPAELRVPGLEDAPAIAGTVRRLEPQGFTKISSLGVEQQRVNVVVDLEPASLEAFRAAGFVIEVGYRVRVRITTARAEDRVIVPRTALFRGPDDGWRCFTAEGGRAVLRTVELGLGNDEEVAVARGLSAGDRVIIAPDADLADGDRVRSAD